MTKKIFTTALVLAAAFSAVPAKFDQRLENSVKTEIISVKTEDVNLAGKWALTVQVPGQPLDVTLDLSQEEKSFSGKMVSAMGEGKIVNGKVTEKDFSCVIQANIQGQDMEIEMSGKVDGEKMTGTLFVPNLDALPFEGSKAK